MIDGLTKNRRRIQSNVNTSQTRTILKQTELGGNLSYPLYLLILTLQTTFSCEVTDAHCFQIQGVLCPGKQTFINLG